MWVIDIANNRKEYLAQEQDAPTVLVIKIMTMHDHYNTPPPDI
ncbi:MULTISPECIES: hypothetical protein [Okeania]|nr:MULTISPECIES: hypothetical protein [Okeania]